MNRFQNEQPSVPDPGHGDAKSPPDASLVQAARRGDKRAFVEIVARHQAMVCGIALGILNDFAASEDAAQEAFLTAWRKIHDLREPERLRAWLGQISRNAALGHLRRQRGAEPLEEAIALPDASPQPDEAAASEEEAALVRESLASLPEAYRLPLVLYYREGNSVRAVAEALELSEDAVKQRLARGREMLRDRMSGLIESVLTRTKPNAILTMTIAAAIGALAAPAAVAGGVFAATAATTVASASAGASTPVLTFMSTSKTLLVSAALVAIACVPVGYQLATRLAPSPGSAPAIADTKTPANAGPPTPNFENSLLFAEWQQLHDAHGRTAEAMPGLLKAINEIKDPFRRRAFRTALVAEWAQIDPANGLKYFLDAKGADAGSRRQFFQEWLAVDPGAAVDALITANSDWHNLARESLKEIARRAPSRLADVVSRLPANDDYWDTNVRDAFAILAESSFASSRQFAESLQGPNREQALAGVVQVWAKSDLDGAMAWAKSLPAGIDRDEIVRTALIGKASVDPAAALELANTVPSGGRHASFGTTTGARVLHEAAVADFDATMAWLTSHPGHFGTKDLEGLAYDVSQRLNADVTGFLNGRVTDGSLAAIVPAIESALLNDSAGQRNAIWEWLKTQPNSDAVSAIKHDVLQSAGFQDPKLALRLAAELPSSPQGDAQLKTLAESLLNGGNALYRLDDLFSKSPERLRQPMLESAFTFLNFQNLDDPQRWTQYLGRLPEANRAAATESLARAWGGASPEAAIEWAARLTGDSQRNALAAAVAGWAGQDVQGASDWVDRLPPGPDRDRTAASLAVTMAPKYPAEAWEWALAIKDPSEQARAATQAALAMASRDPAAAQRWIASSPFSAETRAAIQLAINKKIPSAK